MNAPVSPHHLTPELHEALGKVTLDDKYTLAKGRAYMSGTQALVRLLILQHERDAAAGLNTAGFVSGYRGSPLGGVDQTLWRAKKHLEQHHIAFQPGLNEDLAATSVWGSQQVNMYPGAKYDGVFALDVLEHIRQEDEHAFLRNAFASLTPHRARDTPTPAVILLSSTRRPVAARAPARGRDADDRRRRSGRRHPGHRDRLDLPLRA